MSQFAFSLDRGGMPAIMSGQGMEGKFFSSGDYPLFYPKVPYLDNQTEFEGHPSTKILGNTIRFVVGWVVGSLGVLVRPRNRICA